MIKNYLTISIRRIFNDKLHSLINIVGLSIGIAAFILIIGYICNEFSVNSFIENQDRIFRVKTDDLFDGTVAMPAPLSELIEQKVGSVEQVSRCIYWSQEFPFTIKSNGEGLDLYGLMYSDSVFLKIFNFPIIYGNRQTMLSEINSIVLTQKQAKLIFGTDKVVGRDIITKNNETLVVTGVLKDLPSNSSFYFSALRPIESEYSIRKNKKRLLLWDTWDYGIYILLPNGIRQKEVEEKINREYRLVGDNRIKLQLIPFKNVYFDNIKRDGHRHGNKENIFTLLSIGIFILIIAIINYINLSTAKAMLRSKEVGIRKVSGSSNVQITAQFLLESFIIVAIAMNFAILLVKILSDFLIKLFNYQFSDYSFSWISSIGIIFLGSLILSVIAGIYPALHLNKFQPIKVLTGETSRGVKGEMIRRMLTIFQFIISISLIIATIFILKQNGYVHNMELGFKKENILVVSTPPEWNRDKRAFFAENLKKNNLIDEVAYSHQIIGNISMFQSFTIAPQDTNFMKFIVGRVDHNYLKMMGIQLKEGRSFTDSKTDENTIIINEAAQRIYGLSCTTNNYLYMGEDEKLQIIGIAKDFHFKSLYNTIEPMLFLNFPEDVKNANIKFHVGSSNQISELKMHVENVWKANTEALPLNYKFLDDCIKEQYKRENTYNYLVIIFSFISILIAMLGLYGLISFVSLHRTKEIGIRKVHGASTISIIRLFSLNVVKWIAIAFVIAAPLSWFLMTKWFERFAYRTALSWWVFVLASLIVLLIANVIVIWHSWRVVGRNPVEALRYE